jgi:hypothetical protein
LSEDPNAGKIGVDLSFKSMDDFEPARVAMGVKPLRELIELRTKLSDLVGSLTGAGRGEEIPRPGASPDHRGRRRNEDRRRAESLWAGRDVRHER